MNSSSVSFKLFDALLLDSVSFYMIPLGKTKIITGGTLSQIYSKEMSAVILQY
jgi:hypothetical protein